MKHKEIYGVARTTDYLSILTLGSKRLLLVILWLCANILAIVLPKGVSPTNNTRSQVKCLIFSRQKNHKSLSVHWETSCFTRTGRNDVANSSFSSQLCECT